MSKKPNHKPKASVSVNCQKNRNRNHVLHTCTFGCGEYGGLSSAPNYPDTKAKESSNSAISFFYEFTPPTATAQTRRHNRSGASYLPARTKHAKATLLAVMEKHAPKRPLNGPLTVNLYWTYPNTEKCPGGLQAKATRPDLDNLAKLALDAMTNAGYWNDDAQVAELHTAKFTGPIPGLAVMVKKMSKNFSSPLAIHS